MKRLTIIAALFLTALWTAFSQNRVSLTDFGAFPDDGKDDTQSLRTAAAYCREHPGTVLYCPSGQYILRDEEAVRLERDVLAGRMTRNPESVIFTPYYPYVRGLDFEGSRDITVEAAGAVLMCEGWMEPVSIIGCSGFTLRGLTIDYLRKPFSQGTVTAIGDHTFDVKFAPDQMISETSPVTRMELSDPSIDGMFRDPFYFPTRTILPDGTWRVDSDYRLPDALLGAPVAALHSFHFRPAILILESANTTLEGVTIHSQPGMGIVGFDSRDIFIRGLAVAPAPGYHFSTNTDATHFACCRGKLHIENSRFIHQGDDATNVHGYYHYLEDIGDGWYLQKLDAPTFTHAQVADVPATGDSIEIVNVSTLEVVATVTVSDVLHEESSRDVKVKYNGVLPPAISDCYAFNISKLPRLVFRNNVVLGNLARGVLVKTRNVVVEGNIFKGCTGTAVHVGAESDWKEGTFSKNVLITRNVMVNCGLGAGRQGDASGIAVLADAPALEGILLHENIDIHDNVIIGNGENGFGICVEHASGVSLYNNTVIGCSQEYSMADVERFRE